MTQQADIETELLSFVNQAERVVQFFSVCFVQNRRIYELATKASALAITKKNLKVSCYSSFGIKGWPSLNKVDPKKVAQESIALLELHKLRCEVIWRPRLEYDCILVDYKRGYVFDNDKKEEASGTFTSDHKRLIGLQNGNSGYFKEIVGKVVFIQELLAQPYDVDLFVRLNEIGCEDKRDDGEIECSSFHSSSTQATASSTIPVFLHSQCLDQIIDCGDVIEICGIVNFSGEGIMGGSAASTIFVEGLGVKWLSKADLEESAKYGARTNLRDEVSRLLSSDRRFSIPDWGKSRFGKNWSSSRRRKKKREEWIVWAYGEVRRTLTDRGFYTQAGDDSFIMRRITSIAEKET
jgi:hypothetical protein